MHARRNARAQRARVEATKLRMHGACRKEAAGATRARPGFHGRASTLGVHAGLAQREPDQSVRPIARRANHSATMPNTMCATMLSAIGHGRENDGVAPTRESGITMKFMTT